MKKTLALAACAALSIGFASCGDDDDDDPVTEAPADDAGTTAAGDDTVTTTADGGGTTEPAGAEATQPPASLTGDDAEVLADCQALQTALGEPLDAPEVGGEITDEYRDQLDGARQTLDDLDLETDDAVAARDALVDMINQIAESDTMTQELRDLEENLPDDVNAFGERCSELLAAGG